jgi:hypothetical protein
MGFLDFISEPYGKMIGLGLFLLLIGGGLTFWSYVNRDPVTGEFFVWYKMILAGAVFTAGGLVYWKASQTL